MSHEPGFDRWPERIGDVEQLEELLSRPGDALLSALDGLEGDLLVLGAGGKMGPTLARMAVRGLRAIGSRQRVIAVSRFGAAGLREKLAEWGVETLVCDLLDREQVMALPESANVIFMAGQKFGTTGHEAQTWAMNVYLPALVAERYSAARMVVFSTGNVYPLTPIAHGGSTESDNPEPVGEYANSCLGRERIFAHFAQTRGLRCAIMRLNYAVEMRYGVLVDVARKVWEQQPIDLRMGAANVIWQGDANATALSILAHCATPPFVLNVTGPETVSIRRLAERFGQFFQRAPIFEGEESSSALLNNAGKAYAYFGYPSVPLERLVEWTADWVRRGGESHAKPTHFEARDGRF